MRHKIVTWGEYQHYKGRRPPWIKIHKSILSSENWIMADDASKLLAIVCMLAAQVDKAGDGSFNSDPVYLKKLASLDSLPCLKQLVSSGFLVEVDDASIVLAKSEQSVLSSLSVSVSDSVSVSEGGVGETSSPEDFTGPRPVIPLTDPLTDFEPEVSAQAREFWSLFCIQHHGSIRNCHTEASHREMRHFAKAINAMGDKAVKALRNYYAKPPKEDKALAAYQIIIKLGLQPEVKQPKTSSNFEMLAKAIAGGMKV